MRECRCDALGLLRRAGLVVSACLSLAMGAGGVSALMRPEALAQTDTAMLLGVLGLMVLPPATYAAWRAERRVAQAWRARSIAAEASPPARTPVTQPASESPAVEARRHPPGEGVEHGARRHRRPVVAASDAPTETL